jgi:acyl carrier protein
MTEPSNNWIHHAVVHELGKLMPADASHMQIVDSMSLIDDLGLDSMKFVDLTVGLEEALGIPEFPMQDWIDGLVADGARIDVAALTEACVAVVFAQRQSESTSAQRFGS